MRIDHNQGLKEGDWIEIQDVDDVPHRVHVEIEQMWPEEWSLAAGRKMRDTFMAKVITDWSFGDAPGGKPEALGDLPRGAYKALIKATNPHYIDAGFMADPDAEKKAKQEDSTSEPETSSA